jgi:hypothetical protein
MRTTSTLLLALCLLVGCTPKDAPKTGDSNPSGKPPIATAPAEKPKLADLSENLRHDAFEYYGLGNEKSLDVELKADGQAAKTGGVSTQLDAIADGKATFKVVRSGAIAETLGDNTVEVDATGVYLTGTSIGTIEPERFVALPADLSPGKTWNLKTKIIHNAGQEIEEDSVYKVEGLRDVKTKKGVQKALLVTSTGTANVTVAGKVQKNAYLTKSWYVKGVGPIRFEISLTPPGEPARSVVVEQSQ